MTNAFVRIMFSVVFLATSVEVLGQLTPRFCENDASAGVRAYCKDLADLQNAVNSKGAAATVDDVSGPLNKLDFSHAAATNKFITAAAPRLTTSAAISKATASAILRDAGQARPDQQLGATGNASGTTSLVSRAGSAELLSLALDTGALTQSVNGTTATLTTNADQVFRLVTGYDPDCTVTCKSLGWFENKILSPTNLSASMDLAQQGSTTVPTSGPASGTTPAPVNTAAIPTGAGKLSGITARYQLMNKFDPRSTEFRQTWNALVLNSPALKTAVINLQTATENTMKLLTANAPALNRDEALKQAKQDASGEALSKFFDNYFSNAVDALSQNKELSAAVLDTMPLRSAYRDVWFETLDRAVGTLLTFEYNYNRPINQPQTHDFKLIYAYNFQTMGMFTLNGSVSIYGNTIPAGAKYGRLQYGQISTQYDRTLSGKDKSIQSQLSLAGYWQYQPEPSVLNIPAGTVVPGTNIPLPDGTQEFIGTAGSLWVTQAKLTIKAAGGINIPIGVSWSNKTDLLQGSKVGAQVGISYNFSSLAGLLTGSGVQ